MVEVCVRDVCSLVLTYVLVLRVPPSLQCITYNLQLFNRN